MQKEKRRIMWVVFAVLVTLLSAVGLTYAWMAQRASMTTLLTITPPDAITIIPTKKDGSPMTELDLDYHKDSGDKTDADGTIHIYRPVCIKSTEKIHRLEIVHTTNLNDLNFQIYPATKTTDGNNVVILKKDTTPLSGNYKNETSTGSKLAKEEKLENYQDEDINNNRVEAHAFPLYWIGVNCAIEEKWKEGWQKVTSETEDGADGKTYYNTYYILEISWNETTKETDLFYIMAQNVAQ